MRAFVILIGSSNCVGISGLCIDKVQTLYNEDVVKSRSQSAAVRAKVLVVLTKGGYRKSLRGVAYILHRCQQRSAGWSSAYSNERKSVSQFGR